MWQKASEVLELLLKVSQLMSGKLKSPSSNIVEVGTGDLAITELHAIGVGFGNK